MADVLAHFTHVRESGSGWTARCPAHEDHRASLSIATGDTQPWLVRCHRGCSVEQILTAAGLTMADILMPHSSNGNGSNGHGSRQIVAEYDYTDEHGTLLHQEVRFIPKGFSQRRPDGKGGWIWNLGNVRRVLFGLPDLHGQQVAYVTEGPKDAMRLQALGLVATTNPGGAGKWRDDYTRQLVAAGVRCIVILADHDHPGQAHAAQAARSCHAGGLIVKVPTLPGLHDGPPSAKHGRDVSDWLDEGHTKDELIAIVKDTPVYTPTISDAPEAPAGRCVTLTPASAIRIRPVRWLWAQRLALGTLGLLGGREGIGKTIVAYTLTALITRGRLPGAHLGTPKSVIVAATEDSWEHTIVPRLMAAGADLDRVFRADVTTPEGTDTSLSLPRDLGHIERVITAVDAALIVLDPLLSRLDVALDSHKDAEVRVALEPIVSLAAKTNCFVLGIIHVNKSASTDALNALMGSRAFAAVARSVLFAMTDPDDESARLLGQPKNNLGSTDLPTLAFRIDGCKVAETPEGDVWTGKLHWTGESDKTIRDALHQATEARGENRTAVAEAGDWLQDYLASKDGSADSAEIKRDGAKAGHTKDALHRARVKLNIVSVSVGFPRRTHWMQSSAQSSEESSAQSSEVPGETSVQQTTQTTTANRYFSDGDATTEDPQLSELSESSESPPARATTAKRPTAPNAREPHSDTTERPDHGRF